MAQYPRYAIYFVPDADNALYRFGANLLGYDAFTGNELPFALDIETQIKNWKDVTADPRKYGFHATLKAPMSLASGINEDELIKAVEAFAAMPRMVPVIEPDVRSIGNFIAIVPNIPNIDLQQLSSDCVTVFDRFRAPLTASGRERRNVSALTVRQIEYLDRWGYPYVFEEFRFHMTLTGSLLDGERVEALNILHNRFADLNVAPVAINRIALLRQSADNTPFTIITHRPLQSVG